MAPPCSHPGKIPQRRIGSDSRSDSRSRLPERQPRNGPSRPWRRHGRKRSIFLRVLPWCAANVLVLVVLSAGRRHPDDQLLPNNTKTDATDPAGGGPNDSDSSAPRRWSLLGLVVANGVMVAWLLVARTLRSLRRSRSHRDALERILRHASRLVRTAVLVSRRAGNNHDRASREWRSELAYRAILVVRTAASNAGYPFHKRPAYFLTELDGTELEQCLPPSDGNGNKNRNAGGSELRMRMRMLSTEDSRVPTSRGLASFDVPITLAHLLQETICGQEDRLAHPMSPEHELALLATVDSMMEGYHDLRTLMVTPFPAPLANLIRGLAIGYASLLPLLAVWGRNGNRDGRGDRDADLGAHVRWQLLWNSLRNVQWQWQWLLPACALVGFATLAIAGLLLVSDDLDDPFGRGGLWDASGIAEYCAEEIVRTILESDGPEWAGFLRYRTHRKASEPIRPTLDFDFCGSERGGGKNRNENENENENETLGNANDGREAATETDRLLPGGSEDSAMGEESKERADDPFDDEFVGDDDNEWHEDDSIYFRSRAAMPEWMVER